MNKNPTPLTAEQSNRTYGWFEDSSQTESPYDPTHTADCLYCGKPMRADDVRTHSLMWVGGNRSYFYRTQRTCDQTAQEKGQPNMDGVVSDLIAHIEGKVHEEQ